MFPQLNIYLDGASEATVVQPTSVDFWAYEDLAGAKTSETAMRLTVAFLHIEGREPKNLGEVKAWARDRRVIVTLGEAPDPTQSAATAGS